MKGAQKLLVDVHATAEKISKLRDKDRAGLAQKFLSGGDLLSVSAERPVYMSDLSFFNIHTGVSSWQDEGYVFKDRLYRVKGIYTEEEKQLLVFEAADQERKAFERMQAKFLSQDAKEASKPRPSIPESVRIAVWRRDGGKCIECASRENLEFHHIIPFEKGGASTVRNLQLLCLPCNRKLGNRVDEVTGFRLE